MGSRHQTSRLRGSRGAAQGGFVRCERRASLRAARRAGLGGGAVAHFGCCEKPADASCHNIKKQGWGRRGAKAEARSRRCTFRQLLGTWERRHLHTAYRWEDATHCAILCNATQRLAEDLELVSSRFTNFGNTPTCRVRDTAQGSHDHANPRQTHSPVQGRVSRNHARRRAPRASPRQLSS